MGLDRERTPKQDWLLAVLPRIGACLSLCCAAHLIYTVIKSPYYRQRIYHRIMMAAAINIILQNLVQLWGELAFPQTNFVDGQPSTIPLAKGNITTCTIQGFLFQLLSFAVPAYYVSLSFLGYIALVKYRFQIEKLTWIEKYIHLVVYGLPLSAAIYLAKVEALNPVSRGCGVTSIPIGCGDEIRCVRGPQNIKQLQNWMVVIPYLFILLFPLSVMIVLCLHIRFCSGLKGKKIANSVAKQSTIYLLFLYWSEGFVVIDSALIHRMDLYVFMSNLLKNISDSLIGVWLLLAYWYFSSDEAEKSTRNEDEQDLGVLDQDNNLVRPSPPQRRQQRPSRSLKDSITETFSAIMQKPEFSIFDGSKETTSTANPSPWAEFLIDDYEDSDYLDRCEYDDTQGFVGMSEGQKVTTSPSSAQPTPNYLLPQQQKPEPQPSPSSTEETHSTSEAKVVTIDTAGIISSIDIEKDR